MAIVKEVKFDCPAVGQAATLKINVTELKNGQGEIECSDVGISDCDCARLGNCKAVGSKLDTYEWENCKYKK